MKYQFRETQRKLSTQKDEINISVAFTYEIDHSM